MNDTILKRAASWVGLSLLTVVACQAAPAVNNITGLWQTLRNERRALHKTMGALLAELPTSTATEVDSFLGKSCFFARKVNIAHCEDSVTIIGDNRRRFSVPIVSEDETRGRDGRRLAGRVGSRAAIRRGYLVVEQRGRHTLVSSTFARVPEGTLLCRAVTVQLLDGSSEKPYVLKQVLRPAENDARLPNPWKEPPSILPPVEKRQRNAFQKGVQGLVNIGKMAVPFL